MKYQEGDVLFYDRVGEVKYVFEVMGTVFGIAPGPGLFPQRLYHGLATPLIDKGVLVADIDNVSPAFNVPEKRLFPINSRRINLDSLIKKGEFH